MAQSSTSSTRPVGKPKAAPEPAPEAPSPAAGGDAGSAGPRGPRGRPYTRTAPTSIAGAEGTVVLAATVSAGLWAYRKLIEPGVEADTKGEGPVAGVLRVLGAEPKPASAAEFAVGFGFTFFTLSVLAPFAPDLAKSFSILIIAGTLLANGYAVATDTSAQLNTAKATAAKNVSGKPPVKK